MARRLLLLACVALLCSCAQVATIGTFTAADATQAAAIDPANAACYQAIGAIGAAVGVAQGGILTLVATKMAARNALSSAACAPIEAQVLGDILKATPLAPLVP